jgi:hypothetical protein
MIPFAEALSPFPSVLCKRRYAESPDSVLDDIGVDVPFAGRHRPSSNWAVCIGWKLV